MMNWMPATLILVLVPCALFLEGGAPRTKALEALRHCVALHPADLTAESIDKQDECLRNITRK